MKHTYEFATRRGKTATNSMVAMIAGALKRLEDEQRQQRELRKRLRQQHIVNNLRNRGIVVNGFETTYDGAMTLVKLGA